MHPGSLIKPARGPGNVCHGPAMRSFTFAVEAAAAQGAGGCAGWGWGALGRMDPGQVGAGHSRERDKVMDKV